MKDPRLLCVRMSLNEAISELQDIAVDHPEARDALGGLARDIAAIRDRCTPIQPHVPAEPMAREAYLDNHPFVRAAE